MAPRQTPPRRTAWIRRFHTAPDDAPHVVCFPHAGAGATSYHPLSRALRPYVQVLAVQYPGRQDRINEPCAGDVHELADRIADELRPWADRPPVLFGHSLGSAVAFETAVRLERRGTPPLALVASARRAPSAPLGDHPPIDTDADVLAAMRRLGGADAGLPDDPSFRERVLPMVRSDFRAGNDYRAPAELRVACPVAAFAGTDDPAVDVAEMKGWADHTTAWFRLRTFPGGHFYLDDRTEDVRDELVALATRRGDRPA